MIYRYICRLLSLARRKGGRENREMTENHPILRKPLERTKWKVGNGARIRMTEKRPSSKKITRKKKKIKTREIDEDRKNE